MYDYHLPNLDAELLVAGRCIASHCKGGSGRTGLIAARIARVDWTTPFTEQTHPHETRA